MVLDNPSFTTLENSVPEITIYYQQQFQRHFAEAWQTALTNHRVAIKLAVQEHLCNDNNMYVYN